MASWAYDELIAASPAHLAALFLARTLMDELLRSCEGDSTHRLLTALCVNKALISIRFAKEKQSKMHQRVYQVVRFFTFLSCLGFIFLNSIQGQSAAHLFALTAFLDTRIHTHTSPLSLSFSLALSLK
jgi:hypothetical protein